MEPGESGPFLSGQLVNVVSGYCARYPTFLKPDDTIGGIFDNVAAVRRDYKNVISFNEVIDPVSDSILGKFWKRRGGVKGPCAGFAASES